MIDQSQTELARAFLEQSRNATIQAHQSWDMVMKTQKTMIDSMRNAGPAFAMAADQFDKLVEFQSTQYKAAMAFMDKMSQDYQQLLSKENK